MYKNTQTDSSQSGLVSIIVAMIIMIVLSLIVLGFAKVSRREQRQSLDRQLNKQASYATEAGINDAQEYMKTELAAGRTVGSFSKCRGTPLESFIDAQAAPPINKSNTIDGQSSYSCVLIDPTPPQLIWQNVGVSGSIVTPFTPATAISGITFSWDTNHSSTTDYSGCSAAVGPSPFKPQATWNCQAGALRVDLTPIPSASLDRATLINNTQNFILYPLQTAGFTSKVGPLGHGDIVPVSCANTNTPRHCNLQLSIPNGNYYVRIRPIYLPANIEISGVPSGVGPVLLKDGQAVVDVTGKANDILKRTQVRVPIKPVGAQSSTIFDYAVQTVDSLCKQYTIVPPSTVSANGIGDPSCTTDP